MLLLAGCEPQEWPQDEPPSPPDTTVRALWAAHRGVGVKVTLDPVVVTSPRAWPGDRFFASDPEGGASSAVEIGLGEVVAELPEVGTVVHVSGVVERTDPPRVRIDDQDQIDVLWTGDLPLPYAGTLDPSWEGALVALDDVRVTSSVDPLGRADTDGPIDLGGLFGVTPGFGREGDLVGIWSGGRVSARTPEDWSGELEGDPAVPASLAMLPDLEVGTPVRVANLAMVTPVSADGRWAVLQDGSGAGIWLDLQLAAVDHLPFRPATWEGELRRTAWGVSIRVWDPPAQAGRLRPTVVRDAVAGEPLVDASVVRMTLGGLGPVDAWGDRATEGPTLDDAFLDLGDLPDPVTIVGVAIGTDRVAPLPSGGPPP